MHINKKFGVINNFLKSRRDVLRPEGLRIAALKEVGLTVLLIGKLRRSRLS